MITTQTIPYADTLPDMIRDNESNPDKTKPNHSPLQFPISTSQNPTTPTHQVIIIPTPAYAASAHY